MDVEITEHRLRASGYVVRATAEGLAEAPTPTDEEGCLVIEHPPDPPDDSISRKEYERSQQIEAARLVGSALEYAKESESSGKKVAGEGETIEVEG